MLRRPLASASLGFTTCVFALACTDVGGTDNTEDGPVGSETATETETETETNGDGDPGDGDGDGEPGDGDGDEPLACSGHVELCERRYDEVVFAGTHNSHSATQEGFSQFNANHVHGIPTQLADGVRVMLLDTYYDEADPSQIVLCHGPCGLGSTPHLDVLDTMVEFLEQNPGEILTLIYEDHVEPADLALDYEASGAIALVYEHPDGQPWPTLGELVAADTRLIVTAESGEPPPAWHHNIWQVGWDTPYGPSDPADLSCELNRGSTDNDLYLLNHWVNNDLGLPSPADADVVNEYDFLLARAQECAAMWNHPTNFVVVDWYERGDLFAVVEALNGF